MKLKFVSIALLALVCACVSTLQVKRMNPDSTIKGVHGIPFYVQKVHCVHETVWLETQYQVKLTAFADQSVDKDKKAPARPPKKLREWEKLISESTMRDSTFSKIKVLILSGHERQLERFDSLFKELKVYAFEDVLNDPQYLTLVSNTIKPQLYVDYSTTYFLNSDKPWIGSSSVNAETRPDGTLGKGNAESNDETITSLTALLANVPLKEYLTKVLELTPNEVKFVGVAAHEIPSQYELSIEPIQYLHTLSETIDDCNSGCKPKAASSLTQCNTDSMNYTRTKLSGGGTKAAEKDDSSIKVTGEITLPKSDEKSDKK